LCHSFSWQVGTGVVLPLLQQYSKPFWSPGEYDEIQKLVKSVLENPNIKKIAQNGKFDIQQARHAGINVQNFYADTMLQHYCINENIDHGLKMLAWLYTDYGGYEEELDTIREKYAKEAGISKKEASFNIIPNEILWKYSGMDPDVTLQIYYKLLPILEAEGTIKIFQELYMPFTRFVADMEYEGMNVDKEYLIETQQKFKERIKGLEEQIYRNRDVRIYVESRKKKHREERAAKWDKSKNLQSRYKNREEYCELKIEEIADFNYGSDKQLKELFIDQLQLKIGKRTNGGGASFDKEAMEVYARKVPIAKLIADANKTANLLTIFLDGILDRIRTDGRVHTSLNLQIAESGRLSSSGPNLQNIPNRTNNPTDAKLIRDIYIADSPNHVIIEFDQKQCEFRTWCQMSQDPVMIQDLANGLDIHTDIASEGFKIPKDQVTKEKRDGAKGVVFGKMYGRGNRSVADQLGISIKEAEKIETALFSKYKVASAWLRQVVIKARHDKYVDNLFGFRRHLKGLIDSSDSALRSAAERLAVNAPIQGGASQMVCYAMLKADKLFKENNIRGRLLFPIHDAILFSVHKDDIRRAIPLIEESMIHPHPLINVPLGIDGKIGYRWGSTQTVEEYLQTN
jgi:DNA polymerase-1